MSALIDGKPRTTTIALDDSKVALVSLRKIILPESQGDTAISKSLISRDAARDSQMLLAGLREKAKIVIYKDKL